MSFCVILVYVVLPLPRAKHSINQQGVNSMALRFITNEQMSELINLYHLSRVALSGTGKRGKYAQMLWATSEFHKLHPDISATAAYKDLDGQLAGY